MGCLGPRGLGRSRACKCLTLGGAGRGSARLCCVSLRLDPVTRELLHEDPRFDSKLEVGHVIPILLDIVNSYVTSHKAWLNIFSLLCAVALSGHATEVRAVADTKIGLTLRCARIRHGSRPPTTRPRRCCLTAGEREAHEMKKELVFAVA